MDIENYIKENTLNTIEKLREDFSKKNIVVKGNEKRVILISKLFDNNFQKEADNCVIDVENMKVICSSPYYEKLELKQNQEKIEQDMKWEDVTIEELIDGTVIRIYFDQDEWKIATLHTYDASVAYWYSNKSFKDLFLECSKQFLNWENLDKECSYGFIIRHPENKIVTHYELKDIIHIFTIKNFQEIEVDLGILKPQKIKFDNFDSMICACLQLNYYLPGFLITYNGIKTKYISPHYSYVKGIKGNINNMKIRYLQLRKNGQSNEFLLYYPEMIIMVQEMEQKIIKKVQDLFKKYIDIKVNKKWYDLDKLEKYIIYKVHEIYLKTKLPITYQHVYDFFNSLPYYKIAMGLEIPLNDNKKINESNIEEE